MVCHAPYVRVWFIFTLTTNLATFNFEENAIIFLKNYANEIGFDSCKQIDVLKITVVNKFYFISEHLFLFLRYHQTVAFLYFHCSARQSMNNPSF